MQAYLTFDEVSIMFVRSHLSKSPWKHHSIFSDIHYVVDGFSLYISPTVYDDGETPRALQGLLDLADRAIILLHQQGSRHLPSICRPLEINNVND